MFTAHGRVKDVRLAREKDGTPRGFGIVIFEESKGKAAIAALSGCVAGGRTLKVQGGEEQAEGVSTRRAPQVWSMLMSLGSARSSS